MSMASKNSGRTMAYKVAKNLRYESETRKAAQKTVFMEWKGGVPLQPWEE